MKRREFLKIAAAVAGAGMLAAMNAKRLLVRKETSDQVTKPPKMTKKNEYRYTWDEHESAYVLTLIGYCFE